MAVVETKILNLSALKPLVWKRYVDDIFSIWNVHKHQVTQFIEQANKHHQTIKFTAELSYSGITGIMFLDRKRFAAVGRSTDQALVFLLHLALEALDRGNCSIRSFFADFRKGFDLIDHKILLSKLARFDLHPS